MWPFQFACAFFCIVSRVHGTVGLVVDELVTVSDGSPFTVVRGVVKRYWVSLLVNRIEDDVTLGNDPPSAGIEERV